LCLIKLHGYFNRIYRSHGKDLKGKDFAGGVSVELGRSLSATAILRELAYGNNRTMIYEYYGYKYYRFERRTLTRMYFHTLRMT